MSEGMPGLVLSIFPGVDGLGRGFEEEGFCVVRGPDKLWGGNIKSFHVPLGKFWGVIGGDPCQFHSPLRRMVLATHGPESLAEDMTSEFVRIVSEAQPVWFLRENSPWAYAPVVTGYIVKRLFLNNRWLGEAQERKRCFWFGTWDGRELVVDVASFESPEYELAVTSSTRAVAIRIGGSGKVKRTWQRDQKRRNSQEALRLQGFPPEFLDDAPFTESGKMKVIANMVPLPMARAIAKAVKRAMYAEVVV